MQLFAYKPKEAFLWNAVEGLVLSVILFLTIYHFPIDNGYLFPFSSEQAQKLLYMQYYIASAGFVIGIAIILTFAFYNPQIISKRKVEGLILPLQISLWLYMIAVVAILFFFLFAVASACVQFFGIDPGISLLLVCITFAIACMYKPGEIFLTSPWKAGKSICFSIQDSFTYVRPKKIRI